MQKKIRCTFIGPKEHFAWAIVLHRAKINLQTPTRPKRAQRRMNIGRNIHRVARNMGPKYKKLMFLCSI